MNGVVDQPVRLREIGDGSLKPGAQPSLVRPVHLSAVSAQTGKEFVNHAFDSIPAPAGATSFLLAVNRSNYPAAVKGDGGYLFGLFIDASNDGGVTFSGIGMTAGLPDPGMGDASLEVWLPLDIGRGVLVRPHIAGIEASDVGVYYKFFDRPRAEEEPPHNSVTFDAAAAVAAYNAATSFSFSHAGAASPTNYYGVVHISWTSLTALTPVPKWDTTGSNITMTAVTGTKATSTTFQGSLPGLTQHFELVNPTAGTVTVGITWGGGNVYGKGVASSTWTNVSQSGPSANGVTASGTGTGAGAISLGITSASVDNATVDAAAVEAFGAITANSTNKTAISAAGSGAGGQSGGSSRSAGAVGTVTMTYGITGASGSRWLSSGFEIVEASAGGITATLAKTEAADTSSSAGTLALVGTLTKTEAADTSSAAAAIAITAALTATEGADTSSAAAGVAIAAALSKTEAADTASSAATNAIAATLTASEGADTALSAGTLALAASLAVSEAADSASAAATLALVAQLGATEGADTLSATASTSGEITATLAVTEAADSSTAAATLKIAASLAVTEAPDTLTAEFNDGLPRSAVLQVTEAADTLAATATIPSDTQPSTTSPAASGSQRRRRLPRFRGRIDSTPWPELHAGLRITERGDRLHASALMSVAAQMGFIEAGDYLRADVLLLPGLKILQRARTIRMLEIN